MIVNVTVMSFFTKYKVNICRVCISVVLLLMVFSCMFFSCHDSASSSMRNEQYLKYDSCHSMISSGVSRMEALKYARIAVDIAESLPDERLMLESYIDMSRVLYLLNQYQVALEYAYKAVRLSVKLEDLDAGAEAKRLCGAIYTDLGNSDSAWRYLNEVLDYYNSVNDTTGLVRALGTKAISLGKEGKLDSCIEILDSIYAMSSMQRNYKLMLTTRLNLINAYSLSGNLNRCFGLLDSTFCNIPERYISSKDSLVVRFYDGEIFYKSGKYDDAGRILDGVLDDARKKHCYEILMPSYDYMISLARMEGDYRRVSELLSEKYALKDSVEGLDVQQKIAEMEVIYEVTRKNAEIDKLVMQNRWNIQRIIFIAVFMVGIVIFIVVRMKMKARIAAAEAKVLSKDLDMKREQLTNMAIYFYEQKRMTDSLYVTLKQISAYNDVEDVRKELRNVCSQINSSPVNDTKNRINTYIDNNYHSFITNIGQKYPDLTDSEKRICAMLLVDFSTKDISDVLHISDRSINNIRSKIRKKLSVPDNVSITSFLKKI